MVLLDAELHLFADGEQVGCLLSLGRMR
jgi:hypothetical protein